MIICRLLWKKKEKNILHNLRKYLGRPLVAWVNNELPMNASILLFLSLVCMNVPTIWRVVG